MTISASVESRNESRGAIGFIGVATLNEVPTQREIQPNR